MPWVYLLFFVSGCPALIYQIIWQRALFAIYGTNIQSVTIVVSAFMLGLGLGSFLGGQISRIQRLPTVLIFGVVELGIGAYGLASLWLFQYVGSHTATLPMFAVGMLAFILVLLPTVLMGGTLPFLVAYLVRISRNVGASVGMLYFVNTLGSAFACFLCALYTMRLLGESGSVRLAATLNILVGLSALVAGSLSRRGDPDEAAPAEQSDGPGALLPFPLAMVIVGVSGFISLCNELLWYRACAFTTASRAYAFALLLGAYLEGIAFGSLFAKAACSRKTANPHSHLRLLAGLLGAASLLSFAVVPVMARLWQGTAFAAALPVVIVAAGLSGIIFPLATHIAVAPDHRAGSRMSYLYLSNIVGSTAGTALVGLILMDHFNTREMSILVLVMGLVMAAAVYSRTCSPRSRMLAWGGAAAVAAVLILASGAIFDTIYERMLYKGLYRGDEMRFARLVESRDGVIAVSADKTIYGGGAYDGRFNTSLVHDTNTLVRAYAIPAMHSAPRDVLMIGLSSGSWAQVIANNPAVEHLHIVEIDAAYLPLIRQYPEVESVLRNPKVSVEIDDGRRWLVRHPGRRFDLIVMNTTFNWRAHITNLLSVEFLRLAKQHLLPGGMLYYNTTDSQEVLLTGTSEFRYGLRVVNFLALSDRPLHIDREVWRKHLVDYRIDGRPVFDLTRAEDEKRLNAVLAMTDPASTSIEDAESIRHRCQGQRIITDDNMGTEWK